MLRTTTLITLLAPALLLGGCAEEEPATPPRQTTAVSPFHYPEELWDAAVEGETVLRLFVGPSGTPDTVRVEQTSGYAAFDTAAVRGASDLRFEPALRDEQPVGLWVLLPVQFHLPGGAPAGDTAAATGAADTAAAERAPSPEP